MLCETGLITDMAVLECGDCCLGVTSTKCSLTGNVIRRPVGSRFMDGSTCKVPLIIRIYYSSADQPDALDRGHVPNTIQVSRWKQPDALESFQSLLATCSNSCRRDLAYSNCYLQEWGARLRLWSTLAAEAAENPEDLNARQSSNYRWDYIKVITCPGLFTASLTPSSFVRVGGPAVAARVIRFEDLCTADSFNLVHAAVPFASPALLLHRLQ